MMSHKVLIISVLVSLFVLFKSENTHAAHENEYELAVVLTEIMSNPGWQKIADVQVEHTDTLLFSGNHYLSDDLRVNEENSEKMAKKLGHLDGIMENVRSKYLTTVHALGCAYANVLFEFCHSFANVLSVNAKERHKARSKAHRRTCKGHGNAKNSDDGKFAGRIVEGESVEGWSAEEQSMAIEEPDKKRSKIKNPASYELYKKSIDYGVSSEIISVAVRVLQNSYQMFDYMQGALRYLLEVIPLRVGMDFRDEFRGIAEIQASANEFFTLLVGLLKTVPEFSDVNDWDANTKACNALKRTIGRRMKKNVKPYLHKHCVIVSETIVNPDFTTLMNTFGDRRQSEPQSKIVKDSEKQIDTLVQVFKSSYFSELGFVYGETEHKIGYIYHRSK